MSELFSSSVALPRKDMRELSFVMTLQWRCEFRSRLRWSSYYDKMQARRSQIFWRRAENLLRTSCFAAHHWRGQNKAFNGHVVNEWSQKAIKLVTLLLFIMKIDLAKIFSYVPIKIVWNLASSKSFRQNKAQLDII